MFLLLGRAGLAEDFQSPRPPPALTRIIMVMPQALQATSTGKTSCQFSQWDHLDAGVNRDHTSGLTARSMRLMTPHDTKLEAAACAFQLAVDFQVRVRAVVIMMANELACPLLGRLALSRRPEPEVVQAQHPLGASSRGLKYWWLLCQCVVLASTWLAAPTKALVPPAQRSALVDLYTSTGGPTWTSSTNWLLGDPCSLTSSWLGILCTTNGSPDVTYVLMHRRASP
jgi:hypothetical protein